MGYMTGIRQRLAYRYGEKEANRFCEAVEKKYGEAAKGMAAFLHKSIDELARKEKKQPKNARKIEPLWQLVFGAKP